MSENATLQLIESIYEASLDPPLWDEFASDLSDAFGGAAVCLSLQLPGFTTPPVMFAQGFDPAFRMTFIDPGAALHGAAAQLYARADAAGARVGDGACWLPPGLAPAWFSARLVVDRFAAVQHCLARALPLRPRLSPRRACGSPAALAPLWAGSFCCISIAGRLADV